MTMKKFALASLVYIKSVQGLSPRYPFCVGYDEVIGEEGPQFTDDGLQALRFKQLFLDHPNFNFQFGIYSDFVYDSEVNIDQNPLVDSSSMKVRLNNWADLVVQMASKGEDLSKLQPSDFEGLAHGDKEFQHKKLDMTEMKDSSLEQVHFDFRGAITALEFDSSEGKVTIG